MTHNQHLILPDVKATIKERGQRDPWYNVITPIPQWGKIHLPNKTQVNTQRPVWPWAIDAKKHPVGYACPAGIFGTAIKTYLKEHLQIQLLINWPNEPSYRVQYMI